MNQDGAHPHCDLPEEAWRKIKRKIDWGFVWETKEERDKRRESMERGESNPYAPSTEEISQEELGSAKADLKQAFKWYWNDSEMMFVPPLGYNGKREWSWDDLDDVKEFLYEKGACDECCIHLTLKLRDGRIIYGWASCNTSGWLCESGGRIYMAENQQDIDLYAKGSI
jgi:hypothetical protein